MTAVGWATSASEGEGIGVGGRSVVAWWAAGTRPGRGFVSLFFFNLFCFYFIFTFLFSIIVLISFSFVKL